MAKKNLYASALTAANEIGGTAAGGTFKCEQCGEDYTSPALKVKGKLYPNFVLCQKCRSSEGVAPPPPPTPPKRYTLEEIDKLWGLICPAIYLKTDPEKLPNQDAWKKIRMHEYSHQGLLLVGESGTGKSRMVLLKLYTWFATGKRVKMFDAVKFSSELSKSFDEGGYDEWVTKLCQIDCLYFDDFDKIKVTERVEEALFMIVERRMAQHKPIYITTNLNGAEIEKMFSPTVGAAIVRRLREGCLCLSTGKKS